MKYMHTVAPYYNGPRYSWKTPTTNRSRGKLKCVPHKVLHYEDLGSGEHTTKKIRRELQNGSSPVPKKTQLAVMKTTLPCGESLSTIYIILGWGARGYKYLARST